MKKIKIYKIGHFNHSVEITKLKDWSSKYFIIESSNTVANIDVNHFLDNYVYPNERINQAMGNDEDQIDLKISIIDQPLEGNYYMHRLGDKKAVISIFPVIELLREAKIPIKNYIMRCIYEIVILSYEFEGILQSNIYQVPHHETRSCIFDMNVFIDRVIYSSNKPIICDECKSRLQRKTLPENFIKNIEKELKRIKQPLFYSLENIIKKRPILSLIITALFAITLHILATVIHDYFKEKFEQKIEIKQNEIKKMNY